MTSMTRLTFANNQKELDRKMDQIKQDHERLNPESTVVISHLDPKVHDIEFLKYQTTQLLIGIQIVGKETNNK